MLAWLSTIAPCFTASFIERTHHGPGPHPWFSAHRRDRELKKALEAYWKGDLDQDALHSVGRQLRATHWQLQKDAGIDLLPVGDFAWYDQVLTHSLTFGVIPERFASAKDAQRPADPRHPVRHGPWRHATCCGGDTARRNTPRN